MEGRLLPGSEVDVGSSYHCEAEFTKCWIVHPLVFTGRAQGTDPSSALGLPGPGRETTKLRGSLWARTYSPALVLRTSLAPKLASLGSSNNGVG